jgi:hypothetical protein
VRTRDRLAAPVFSPDGRRIVYQRMPREDWELYLVSSDGTGERRLRATAERTFAPFAGAVRAAVADVSVSRIYGYARDLYAFDSKHIARPGNALAIEYLARTLASFSYEPELQWFEPRPGIRTANVIATLRGTANPDAVYVVSSHFDSVEPGPGADDNTSGPRPCSRPRGCWPGGRSPRRSSSRSSRARKRGCSAAASSCAGRRPRPSGSPEP